MAQADALDLAFVRAHTRDAAHLLGLLECVEVAAYLETLPPADAAIVLVRLVPQVAAECLQFMTVPAGARTLEHVPPDLCALLLRRVDVGRRLRLVESLPAGLAASVRSALRYSEAVVGSVMDANVPTLNQDFTVSQALDLLRRMPASGGSLFVVDDDQRFTGTVEATRLIAAPGTVPLARLQDRDVEVFSARLEIADLLQHPVWHRCDMAPVVDQKGILLGGLRRGALATALAAGRAEDLRDNSITALLFDCADVFWSACADLFAPARTGRGDRRR